MVNNRSQYTYCPIYRRKENQRMKFGHLIEIIRKILFFKNHAENEAGRLVPDRFLFLKKAFYEVNTSDLQLSFNIFQ